MKFTQSIDNLIKEFSKLPGIGTKTATTLAFSIISYPENQAKLLADAIKTVKEKVKYCKQCFNISESDICPICLNAKRDNSVICVVEKPSDLFSIENSNSYKGLYHVLHGRLAPVSGIGPEDLKIKELVQRVEKDNIKEIILATNPDIEGEATAAYISRSLSGIVERITKLAMGIPLGANLEYADARTLSVSLTNRENYSINGSI